MSEQTIITASEGKGSENQASFAYDFGNAADVLVNFPAEVVHSSFVAYQKICAQNVMRANLKAGKTADEVAAYMSENWKPGAILSDPTTSTINKISAIKDPTERTAAIQKLMDQLNAMKA